MLRTFHVRRLARHPFVLLAGQAHDDDLADWRRHAEVAAGVARPAPTRGSGTILLVEDEPLVRRTTRRILESLGYRVLEAGGGEEALAVAGPFDLLMTDVMMPGMNGTDLAQRLQARHPGLPALLVTGYAAGALAERGGEHLPVLQKPFTVEDLASRVREALEAGGRPAAARAPSPPA